MEALRHPLTSLVSFYRLLVISVICLGMMPIATFFFAIGKSADWGHWHLRRIWSGLILKLCFIRSEVIGLENLDLDSTYVFCLNHKSEWDWYVFTYHVPFNWRAVIRADLTNYAFVGRMVQKTGQIFLKRGGGVEGMIEQCRPHIDKGRSIFQCPEGQRTVSEYLDDFRIGSFALAERTGVPVVPVTIKEKKPSKRKGLFGRRFGHSPGKVQVIVSAPIGAPKQGSAEEKARKLRSDCHAVILAELKSDKSP